MSSRTQVSYNERRMQAIQAAASVFANKGFHGATTKDIADHMGIRQGSLYYYFKSKEEALEEVCALALRDYVQGMEAIADSDLSFRDKLAAIVHAHLASYRDKNEALKVHNDQRLYLPPERREKIKRDGSRYRQRLEQLFADEVAAGNLPAHLDCHFTAQSVIGLCNAWGGHIVRDPALDPADTGARCASLLLFGITAGHPA